MAKRKHVKHISSNEQRYIIVSMYKCIQVHITSVTYISMSRKGIYSFALDGPDVTIISVVHALQCVCEYVSMCVVANGTLMV